MSVHPALTVPPLPPGTVYELCIEWAETGPPARRVRLRAASPAGTGEWVDFDDIDRFLRHLWQVLDTGPGLR